ncbi:MAG: 4-hydroxy-tetrahydrodipicolinate synthase [SAR324 cluster bacterium]|nr:4-hydroxy-tetrahydrodipicolinate synthase [SAR324 cluster bacterium]
MDRLKTARLITAIKTPYLENGKFDLDTFDQLVENQINNGVEGLVVAGTTGEGHLMDWDEEIMLIAHCVHYFGDKLAIIGNTGSNNTREAIHATYQGFAVGMDAALQINPYYGKTSQEGLKTHFERVFDLGPAVVYNVPGRTGQDLEPAIIEELAQHANFVGVKECQGPERIAGYTQKGIRCWSGNDNDCFVSRHQSGGNGVISVTANVVPGLMRKLLDSEDTSLNEKLQPLMSWLFCEPNPIPLNTALSMTGAIAPVFRLPYVPLNIEQRKEGLELMHQFEANDLTGGQPQLLDDQEFILV